VTLQVQREGLGFTPEQTAAVEQAWQARPPHIFNGALLVYRGQSGTEEALTLWGSFVEYRFYYAQRRGGVSLGLSPIGVSGLMLCEGDLVFARRSPYVTAYPNGLELVPSGGLDPDTTRPDGTVDYVAQLEREFEEETGAPTSAILDCLVLGAVYDAPDATYDLACRLRLGLSQAELAAYMAGRDEYGAPIFIPPSGLATWVAEHRTELLPATHAVLDLWQAAGCP